MEQSEKLKKKTTKTKTKTKQARHRKKIRSFFFFREVYQKASTSCTRPSFPGSRPNAATDSKLMFIRVGKIHPRDLKLSEVMATSAAALALNMGVYDERAEEVRKLQMLLGVHFGKSFISDPSRDVAGSTFSCCKVKASFLQDLIAWSIDLPYIYIYFLQWRFHK